MMDDLELLHDLFKNECLAPVVDNYGRKMLTLREPGNAPESAYTLEIRSAPDDVIAIKADAFPAPEKIFENTRGECKRADFIIVAKTVSGNRIVYLEMKRGKSGSQTEIVQQLKGAVCLVAYCRAIGRAFWQEPEFLEEKNYQPRFVSVRNIGMNKRPTRYQFRPKLHDKPESMLKINASGRNTLQFNQLMGPS